MLNFLKAYTDGKVREAANRTTEALALYDPKGMTEAQIQIDEKSMDEIGKRVAHTTTQYNDAKKLLDQAINLNNQRLHAAELIQSKIDAAQTGDSAAAQTASLNTLVNQIESAQSEIENFKTDASDIKSLLDDLISAYTAASTKLKNERQDLAPGRTGERKS
jgi:predicted  nucleic acid-binding Zn-ribbon protein